jgi:hypothetical protein
MFLTKIGAELGLNFAKNQYGIYLETGFSGSPNKKEVIK